MSKPSVLFVCQSNSGKSAMAAALMRSLGDDIDVYSGGTVPGDAHNATADESCAAVGAPITEDPHAVDPEVQRNADRIIVLGTNAKLPRLDGQRALVERWVPAEPSDRGLEGRERMDALRDDILNRVKDLRAEMVDGVPAVAPVMPAAGGCGCGGCGCGAN